ncbi:MAG TPA: iron ABC transporter permease [Candidatus Obscuribacter sp.]|nr:iron ABC transporter permease [Candidatus Obscuribacter sp.]
MYLRLTILLLLLLAAFTANLCLGEVNLSPLQAWPLLYGQGDEANLQVIREIRLPRLLSAALIGLALSTAGYLLQKLSRNQLADPYLTGVSSGAALGVAAAILIGLDLSLVPLIALMGGAATSLLVIVLSSRGGGSTASVSIPRLLLSGIALSSIASAAINLVMPVFGTQTMAQGLSLWLLGGLSGRNWSELLPAACYTLPALAVALMSSKQLRLLSLGEETAASLGLDVRKSQLVILSSAITLTAGAVSLSGLVGFVGLIGPHLARRFVPEGERLQLAAAALCGCILTLAADLGARIILPGQELPLGSLMAVAGGPIFIYLLSKSLDQVVER